MDQKLLEAEIRLYDEKYRQGDPVVSDAEYDHLIEVLKENFPDSELLSTGILPTKVSRKENLPIRMASLNKCKSLKELKDWIKSKELNNPIVVITPKFDGISLLVDDSVGKCWTRGDGFVGQRSDRHFKKLNSHDWRSHFLTFGEAIMPKRKFQKYDQFKTARNLVAGLFNRDIPSDYLADVDYVCYGLVGDYSKDQQLEHLYKANYTVSAHIVTRFDDIDERRLEELYREWSEEYDIDGLVIDINDLEIIQELGREENGNPAFARAYKNPDWSSSADVEVICVIWNISKQGKLKPVIDIVPTIINGVMISNVTGYNAKYVFDNHITSGSTIKIIRSGDVIPKHIKTIEKGSEVSLMKERLKFCPSCGSEVVWDETQTELVCTNENCKEKNISKLVHFFKTVKVEGFGEPSIRKFYDAGFDTIETILKMDLSSISSIDGFGEKSAKILLKEFEKLQTKGVSFAKYLHALDVMEGKLGEKIIQKILDTVEFSELKSESIVASVDGVAAKTAKIFIEGMHRFWYNNYEIKLPVNISFIRSLKEKFVGDEYLNEKLCFTGCRPTEELKNKIESEGGEIVNGVSKNTTMLVVKDMSEKTLSSSKAKKAKELNIKIVELKSIEL